MQSSLAVDSDLRGSCGGSNGGEDSPLAILQARIENKQARIGIIGLGYVGLPLARAFAGQGFAVLGFDLDSAKIVSLRRGESYLGHIPAEAIRRLRDSSFEATDRVERLHEADVIIVCVPTPLTEAQEPDLSHVIGSTRAIAERLRPGQLIVLESTTYPGTTAQRSSPDSGGARLKAGKDFFLAFSPEREDPGNTNYSTSTIPKVVGGFNAQSLQLATRVYRQIVGNVVQASSLEVAEAAKILENTYRAVNIALVNELKVLFDRMGIDIGEVIEAAKTKPFGFQAFYPGPGLGGHCIPIDPFYLAWVARQYGMRTRFIELAGEVNTAMPGYVLDKVVEALNERGKPVKDSKVLVLGVAYKKDVDDSRESPGLVLLQMLIKKGAAASYNDPHIPKLQRKSDGLAFGMQSKPLTAEFVAEQDCVLIVTDHSAYDWAWIVEQARLVVDTRYATRGVSQNRGRIVRA